METETAEPWSEEIGGNFSSINPGVSTSRRAASTIQVVVIQIAEPLFDICTLSHPESSVK